MLSVRIKGLRKEAGLSQEQLAEKIGVSRQAVTKWETGLGLPDLDNLVRLADMFNVTTDSLLRDTPKRVSVSSWRTYESESICDLEGTCDFDIACGYANHVELVGGLSEKVHITLGSDRISDIEKKYKVRLGTGGDTFDISVVPADGATSAEARGSLDIRVVIPSAWMNHVEIAATADTLDVSGLAVTHTEIGGNLNVVSLEGIGGHVDIDVHNGLQIVSDDLPAQLNVNQQSASSTLLIPAGTPFVTRNRGRRCIVVLDGIEETADAPSTIALGGVGSQLTIRHA